MARRNAALLCSAEAFPARRNEDLQGALGIGGGGGVAAQAGVPRGDCGHEVGAGRACGIFEGLEDALRRGREEELMTSNCAVLGHGNKLTAAGVWLLVQVVGYLG